jgi:hypothetical protein
MVSHFNVPFAATFCAAYFSRSIILSPSDDLKRLRRLSFFRAQFSWLQSPATQRALFVLLVMVGEEAQEMQLARWLPTTEIPWLALAIPSWMGLWFSVFPTVETLSAQALAGVLVFGSYIAAQPFARLKGQVSGESPESRMRSSDWSA